MNYCETRYKIEFNDDGCIFYYASSDKGYDLSDEGIEATLFTSLDEAKKINECYNNDGEIIPVINSFEGIRLSDIMNDEGLSKHLGVISTGMIMGYLISKGNKTLLEISNFILDKDKSEFERIIQAIINYYSIHISDVLDYNNNDSDMITSYYSWINYELKGGGVPSSDLDLEFESNKNERYFEYLDIRFRDVLKVQNKIYN